MCVYIYIYIYNQLSEHQIMGWKAGEQFLMSDNPPASNAKYKQLCS